MLARLLGREEPNEDEPEEEQEETSRWRSDQMLVEEGSGPTTAASPEAAALAQEGEPVYYMRIFNEYVAALKSQGKPTKGITVQAFTAKLRLIEGGLKQKWKCRMVRFKVNTQGEQATLKPIPIN
jgi:wyosine [tRNA(Phe)-imidazoG37] synthetase (radical SAM superfamily)